MLKLFQTVLLALCSFLKQGFAETTGIILVKSDFEKFGITLLPKSTARFQVKAYFAKDEFSLYQLVERSQIK